MIREEEEEEHEEEQLVAHKIPYLRAVNHELGQGKAERVSGSTSFSSFL